MPELPLKTSTIGIPASWPIGPCGPSRRLSRVRPSTSGASSESLVVRFGVYVRAQCLPMTRFGATSRDMDSRPGVSHRYRPRTAAHPDRAADNRRPDRQSQPHRKKSFPFASHATTILHPAPNKAKATSKPRAMRARDLVAPRRKERVCSRREVTGQALHRRVVSAVRRPCALPHPYGVCPRKVKLY